MTSPNSDLAIEIRDLRKSFRTGFSGRKIAEVLKGLSLTVAKGAVVGFLGPNGAGKTTTIKVLTGLIFPTGGEVKVWGGAPTEARVRKGFGYLPELPSFQDYLTGEEVLDFAGSILGMPAKERRAASIRLLGTVGLAHAAKLQVRRYSKGMTQRLGIAQALLNDPPLLILDEPMSGLDAVGRREVRDLIRGLRSDGRTIFFSTHIISDIEDVCDRVAMVIGGRVVREGGLVELLGAGAGEMEIVATGVAEPLARRPEASSFGGAVSFRVPDQESAKALAAELWATGARIQSMVTRRPKLEDLFLAELQRKPDARGDAP